MKCGIFACLALVLGALPVGASEDQLLIRGKVFTANPLAPYAEAVGIRADRIVAVGSVREVTASLGANPSIVDLHGHTLMPGLIDSHAHAVGGGVSLITADVENRAMTVDELAAAALDAKRTGRGMYGDVLTVSGVAMATWTQLDELNARFSGGEFAKQPVALYGMDGHTVWGNAALLQQAGVNRQYLSHLSESRRKYFGFDAKMTPNGFAVDEGADYLTRKVPPPDDTRVLEGARAAVKYLNHYGITAWLEPGIETSALSAYRVLAQSKELTAHVSVHVIVRPNDRDPLSPVLAMRRDFAKVPDVRISGIKVFADGVAEYPAQSAAMFKPYAITGKTGSLLFDPGKFADVCIAADQAGLTIHVHAIGDRAVNEALNGIAAARRANPDGHLPHTITHAQFVRAEDIPRFHELRVIASLQLFWARPATTTQELLQPYVDPEIYRSMYPARSLLDAGTVIAGASDWNVTTPNVFLGIYRAETRTSERGTLNPSEDMPREAMLYAYTINAARALGQEDRIGSIEPGKAADLVLVDRDVLTVPAEQLKDTGVVWTMFGGKIVYEAPSGEG